MQRSFDEVEISKVSLDGPYRTDIDRRMKAASSVSIYGDEVQKMYRVPSTPHYSETSVRVLIKRPKYVPGREDRALVVALVSLTFLVQVRITNDLTHESGTCQSSAGSPY